MLLANPHTDVNVQASQVRGSSHRTILTRHILIFFVNTSCFFQSQEGVSALIGAAYKGHTKIVAMLLASPKIDVNYQDSVRQGNLSARRLYFLVFSQNSI